MATIANTILYWSFERGDRAAILAVVAEHGLGNRAIRIFEAGSIVEIDDADRALLDASLRLLGTGHLQSAAFLGAPLDENERWIVVEWFGRLVVEAHLFEKTELVAGAEPIAAGDRKILVVQPTSIAGDGQGSEWLVTHGGETVLMETVSRDPRYFYGIYCDEHIGGASALFAAGREASIVQGLDSSTLIVDTPERFGFEFDRSDSSINAWRRRRMIKAEAIGFSLDDWEIAHAFAVQAGHEGAFVPFVDEALPWRSDGKPYGIALLLTGLEDPPVIIPTGTVFQQPTLGNGFQNLATAQGSSVVVPANATIPVVLPAYCLNRSLTPPHGPVAPTSLVYPGAGRSQQHVWNSIHRLYQARS